MASAASTSSGSGRSGNDSTEANAQVCAHWKHTDIQVRATQTLSKSQDEQPACFQRGQQLQGEWRDAIPAVKAQHRAQQSTAISDVLHLEQQANNALPPLSDWQLAPRIVYSDNVWAARSSVIPRTGRIALAELLPTSHGRTMESALVTTFAPWSPAFLIDHIPSSAALTLIASGADEEFASPDANGDGDAAVGGGNEIESPTTSEQLRWVCLHPHHVPRICDWCDRGITLGAPYFSCLQCDDLDLCEACEPLARSGAAVREKFTADERRRHDPYAHRLERRTQMWPPTCDCTRKRSVQWIDPKLSPAPAYSIFHAKLMLLPYASHLRVVISSFNTDQFRQWDTMTDTFWICDFPRLERGPCVRETGNVFFGDLTHFLRAAGAQRWARCLDELRLDLGGLPKGTILLSSIPSGFCDCPSDRHAGEKNDLLRHRGGPGSSTQASASLATSASGATHRHGLPALHHALSQHHPPAASVAGPVYVSGFSVGAAKNWWLHSFAAAAGVSLGPDLRIVTDASSTYFDVDMRLRDFGSLWRADPAASPLHSHSKLMLRAWQHSAVCSRVHGWVYVGSHNFSKASWGTMDGDRHLWELGVLSISTCDRARASPVKTSSHSSDADCCDGWPLGQVPLWFDIREVAPISWRHSLHIPEFASGKGQVVRAFARVGDETEKNAGSSSARRLDGDQHRQRRGIGAVDATLDVANSIVVFVSSDRVPVVLARSVWPSSLPFPPPPNMLLYVRLCVSERRVVWVERWFQQANKDQVSGAETVGTASARSVYVPPHRRGLGR